MVEREGVIAPAPVVADARPAIDNQRIDAERLEARADRQAGLAATDNEHLRVAIGIGARRAAPVEPVGAREIARIRLAGRTSLTDALFMAAQLLERRQQRPGARRITVVLASEAQDPAAAAERGIEAKNGLDARGTGPRSAPRRGTIRVGAKGARTRLGRFAFKALGYRLRAAEGAQPPAESEDVAPIGVAA